LPGTYTLRSASQQTSVTAKPYLPERGETKTLQRGNATATVERIG